MPQLMHLKKKNIAKIQPIKFQPIDSQSCKRIGQGGCTRGHIKVNYHPIL